MMHTRMNQMATGNDLKRLGAQIDTNIENVASKVDRLISTVNIIDEKMNKTNGRVDSMEETTMATRRDIDNIKSGQFMPPPKRAPRISIGGASSASGASSSSTTASGKEWMPRVIHLRGWSPLGAGPEAQINRADAKKL